MARQKAGEEAYRTLDLLTGLYEPKVQRELLPFGLDDEEVEGVNAPQAVWATS